MLKGVPKNYSYAKSQILWLVKYQIKKKVVHNSLLGICGESDLVDDINYLREDALKKVKIGKCFYN